MIRNDENKLMQPLLLIRKYMQIIEKLKGYFGFNNKTDINSITKDMPTKHWDENVYRVESKKLKGWLDSEFIEENYIRPQISGDKGIYYLHYFLNKHVKQLPAIKGLSLCCGGGNLERALIQLNAAKTIDAFDSSPESIRLAIDLAEKSRLSDRIQYYLQDVNKINFVPRTYDFVIAKMALHHVTDLEHVFKQVKCCLKPGGVFMINDFVGPSRYQWTDLQLDLMNKLLQILPEKNRFSFFNNAPLLQIERPSVEEMITMDPTEAIRSEEIIEVLQKYFKIIEFKKYGGTLLHILLNHVMGSFDIEDENQKALLQMMFLFERTLIEQNVLKSDFAYVVSRPH